VNKQMGMPDATGLVADGTSVYFGGSASSRKPMAFARELVRAGRQDLDVMTFVGSAEIEVLVAGGAARSVAAAYVGLGDLGAAPRFRKAVEEGALEDREHSEWTLVGGLRAGAMGIPFLPTRAAMGSEIGDRLGIEEIDDPYGGGRHLAIRPIRPDVTVIHAWRASAAGNVQMSWPPEHLWDVDVVAARAARTLVVTVEEVVPDDVIEQVAQLTRLFSFEVDAVVAAPGGSWPTASPPVTREDHDAIADYARSGGPADHPLVVGPA